MAAGVFKVLVLFMGPAFALIHLEIVPRKVARLTIVAVRCRDKMRDGSWGKKLWA